MTLEELIRAGFHFGHRTSRWNPKMKPYIFGRHNLIHIINLRETLRGLITAHKFLTKLSGSGKDVLFVGTKWQARNTVTREARRAGMHFVTERWLGGTLTNFNTISLRIKHLKELEELLAGEDANQYSKKIISSLNREARKLKKNLDGMRNMTELPGAVIIVDPNREITAVKEANKLGIPTICLTDTDCDPDLVDICIPGNDDAMRSIEVFLTKMTDAVLNGKPSEPVVSHQEVGQP
ncbi:MAG: 30S ribosomal protein S2 [Candidatus Brocadiales bacterium]|nr:30S ribosomal protein S2 [Candidatus Bathyanammoxibius sp.]